MQTEPDMFYPTNLQPMDPANDLLADPPALRAKFQADGYLLFRQIVPVEKVAALRREITGILAEIGWILGGRDILEAKAIGLPQREGEPGYFEALDRVVRLESLYALAQNEALVDVMAKALGGSVFPHPLSVTRLVFPNNPEITTPPHQDYPNNQGTPNLTAAWIPLGDCPIDRGPLAILKGSHHHGLQPLQYHLGPGNRAAVIPEILRNLPWVTADFEAGDVLLFPSLTVHSALENRDPECMRLSVDYRYQREGEALTAGCLDPHFGRVTWEEIYRTWKSDTFKYYWKKKQYTVVPWNDKAHWLPEDHLKDAIRQGIQYERARRRRHDENPLVRTPSPPTEPG